MNPHLAQTQLLKLCECNIIEDRERCCGGLQESQHSADDDLVPVNYITKTMCSSFTWFCARTQAIKPSEYYVQKKTGMFL